MLVDEIHWRYVRKNKCEEIKAPELSDGRIYPHEFLFLMSNGWDLLDAMLKMCKEMPQLDREQETFLQQYKKFGKYRDMISPEDVKEDIERNLNKNKKSGGNNDDRDLLYRIDLKLSLEDKLAEVCPKTKLKSMQNRNFGDHYPYVEEYAWELENKDLKARVGDKVEEREKQENREKEKKQLKGHSKKRSAFSSPAGKARPGVSPSKFGSTLDTATKSGNDQIIDDE